MKPPAVKNGIGELASVVEQLELSSLLSGESMRMMPCWPSIREL